MGRDSGPAACAFVAMLCSAMTAGPAWADGLLDGFTVREEASYSLLSSRTRDTLSGLTTRTENETYGTKTNVRLNYLLLPKLHLNGGATYEKDYSNLSADPTDLETEVTRFRPFAWLTLRDPVLGAAVGYDLADETVKNAGSPETTLTRETYNGSFEWKPADLPATQVRYTRTSISDEPQVSLDTRQDLAFVKSEYFYRGLNAYYAGTYLDTTDQLRDLGSTQLTHEGKLLYSINLLGDRLSVTTDHRARVTDIATDTGLRVTGLEHTIQLTLPATAGLSSLDDTPVDTALAANPALIDGLTDAGAGVNIGFPGIGGDLRRRNVGLDFATPTTVNKFSIWFVLPGGNPRPGEPGALPSEVGLSFVWDIYTSTDNLTWTFHTTVGTTAFGPFVNRLEVNFPAVTARYVKAVTRPLSGGIIGSTNTSTFPSIDISELQAFFDRTVRDDRRVRTQHFTQILRSHNLDVRAVLFRTPSLYYRFTGDYQELSFEEDIQERYTVSNGLFFTHRFNPIFSTNLNASVEFGREREEPRTATLYYASLAATPLRTLTDSLVFSGSRQWLGSSAATNDSVVLYNTAQLYQGLDATLNFGANFTSNEEDGQTQSRRRDLYVNAGTSVSPHRSFTTTAYYLGKLSSLSGGPLGGPRDTTENQLDLTASFTPFRTLVVSAGANIATQTDRETTTTQNYGVNWAPFPDGTLQFSVFYSENRLPDDTTSRIVQPVVRWYLNARRRTYLEASYQRNTSDTISTTTDSELVSTRLIIDF